MRQSSLIFIALGIVASIYFFKSAVQHEDRATATRTATNKDTDADKDINTVEFRKTTPEQTDGSSPPKNNQAVQSDSKSPSIDAAPRPHIESKQNQLRLKSGTSDSILTINELRQRYAVADLRETLKAAKPFDPSNLELPSRALLALRFKSAKGEVFHYRQGGSNGVGCLSLKMNGRPPIIGRLDDQSLKQWELPDRYAAIASLRDTYYFLILTEVSEERQQNHELQNHLHYLYRRHKDGSIRFLASLDGEEAHRGDVFKMTPEEFCRDSFVEE